MSSDNDLDSDNKYPYDLVAFPKYKDADGRIYVDILLNSWTSFSRKNNQHEAKFPPPPYNKNTVSEISKLLKTSQKAPEYWSNYEIEFRGRAKTLQEAKVLLKKLEYKEYVFTTDSEVTGEEIAKSVKKRRETKMLKITPEEEDQIFKVSKPNSFTSKNSNSNSVVSNESQSSYNESEGSSENEFQESLKVINTTNKPKRKGNEDFVQHSSKKLKLMLPITSKPTVLNEDDGHTPYKNSSQNSKVHFPKNLKSMPAKSKADALEKSDIRLSSKIYGHDSIKISSKNAEMKGQHINKQTSSETLESANQKFQNEDNVVKMIKVSTETLKASVAAERSKGDFDIFEKRIASEDLENTGVLFNRILDALHIIHLNQVELQRQQTELKAILISYGGNLELPQTFGEKYNLTFPISQLEDFNNFEKTLKSDTTFRHEFKQTFNNLIDRNGILTRTITNILKTYLARDIVLLFNAIRKNESKTLVFKETEIYKCIFDVVTKQFQLNNKNLTQKEFLKALGPILTNAVDWDGYRSLRTKNINLSDLPVVLLDVKGNDEQSVQEEKEI